MQERPPQAARMLKDLKALALILSVSVVVAYWYFNHVDKVHYERRLELHDQIVAGTAPAPYRYRVLVPLTVEVVARPLSAVLSQETSFLTAYAAYDVLAVFFMLATLFVWFRTWFSAEQALVGVLFVGGTMPIALQDHFFQPWSLLEAGLFSAALVAIHRRRYLLLCVLVAVAAFNRETAVFIPALFLATRGLEGRLEPDDGVKKAWEATPVAAIAFLFLVWAAVYGGLRYALGSSPHVESVERLLAHNVATLPLATLNVGLFFGVMWVFAFLGFRRAPRFVKRAALVVPAYLATVIIWGLWYEVRLLMPLYPLVLPLGLSFLFSRDADDS